MKVIYFDGIKDSPEFIELLKKGNIIIIKKFFNHNVINLLKKSVTLLNKHESRWMPFYDNCEDYHRINNEYSKSYARAKTHSFLFHFFKNKNKTLLKLTKKIWDFKFSLAKINEDQERQKILEALPSSGYVPRIVAHLYPSGGGYLSKHTDPVNNLNVIQTLVIGSEYNKDFNNGGLFVYSKSSNKSIFVDEHCEKGDLLLIDQSFTHEVKPIDNSKKLNWSSLSGRLQYVFIFARSDYLKGKVNEVQQK